MAVDVGRNEVKDIRVLFQFTRNSQDLAIYSYSYANKGFTLPFIHEPDSYKAIYINFTPAPQLYG